MEMPAAASSKLMRISGLKVHYLDAGAGRPVLLLHGWPTSSYLWRKIIPSLAKKRRVIAPDLPGFGKSDKPLDLSYTYEFYSDFAGRFLDALDVNKTAMVVHDEGGPIGLLWATKNPQRLEQLAILNTFVYPKPSLLLRLILLALKTPGVNSFLVSPYGIATIIKIGTVNKKFLTGNVIASYQAPYRSAEARKVLLKAVNDGSLSELEGLVSKLKSLDVPMVIIYGENDPYLRQEIKWLVADIDKAQSIPIPDCGHFVPEDSPEKLSELLVGFFA